MNEADLTRGSAEWMIIPEIKILVVVQRKQSRGRGVGEIE